MPNDKEIKPRFLNGKTYYTLYQVLLAYTRMNRFNSQMISPELLEILRKETYVDAQGKTQNMFIYPSPIGISTRKVLSIYQEAIPTFLKKWGPYFNVPKHIIQNLNNHFQFNEADSSLLLIDDFCKTYFLPQSVAHWIKNNAFTTLENKDKTNPFFTYASDAFMQKHLYLYKERINEFIIQNHEILTFFGFSQELLKKIKQAPFTPLENLSKFVKEDKLTSIQLRLDELVKILKKTTLFIPILRDFIIQNCLKDKFSLTLPNQKKIELPFFSYYIGFNRTKPSCYIFKKAIPYFVKKYQYELLKLGVHQKVLNELINIKRDEQQPLIRLVDIYLLHLPNVDYPTFKSVLLADEKTPLQAFDNAYRGNNTAIIQVRDTLKDPYFIYQSAIIPLLKKNKKELRLTSEQILRTQVLLTKQTSNAIPTSYFLKNIGLSKKFTKSFNQEILHPHLQLIFQQNSEEGTEYIIPFGFFKDTSGSRRLGVYLEATPYIIRHFKNQLIKIGIDKKHIDRLEKHASTLLPTPQKRAHQTNKNQPSSQKRERE